MADQVIALELNIDTNAPDALDQIQQKIEELKQKVAGAKDGTQELVDAQAQLSQAQDLYQQLTTAADTHTQSVKGGTEAYREFRSETRQGLGNLLSLQKGTAEYNAELKKIASHKAEFRELQEQIALLNPNQSIQQFAQLGRQGAEAFRGIGAAAAFATGSDDEFLKTLFKVEAVTEAMNGAIALQELYHKRNAIAVGIETAAQRVLNYVQSLSPLGAIALALAAIGAAIGVYEANIKSLVQELEEEIKTNDELIEQQDKVAEGVDALNKAEIHRLESMKASDDEIERVKKKQHDAERAMLRSQYTMQLQSLEEQKAINSQKLGDHVGYWQGLTAILSTGFGLWGSVDDALQKKIKENNKELEDVLAKREKTVNDLKAKILQLDAEERDSDNKKTEQRQKKYADDAKKRAAAEKKEQDDMLKDLEESQDARTRSDENWRKTNEKIIKDANEKEILLIKGSGKSELDILMAQQQEEIRLSDGSELALLKIAQKYDDLRLNYFKKTEDEKTKKAEDAQKDRANIQKAELQTATSIGDALVSLGDILGKKGQEQTAAQKALALIQIAIKEAVSIANIMESSTANPLNSVTFGAAGIAQAAAGLAELAGNIAAAKNILDGGSGGSISTSSGGGSPSYSAPQINSTAFGGNPKTDKNGNADYGYNGMIKTYVTSTDLDEAQRRAYYQNLNRRAH